MQPVHEPNQVEEILPMDTDYDLAFQIEKQISKVIDRSDYDEYHFAIKGGVSKLAESDMVGILARYIRARIHTFGGPVDFAIGPKKKIVNAGKERKLYLDGIQFRRETTEPKNFRKISNYRMDPTPISQRTLLGFSHCKYIDLEVMAHGYAYIRNLFARFVELDTKGDGMVLGVSFHVEAYPVAKANSKDQTVKKVNAALKKLIQAEPCFNAETLSNEAGIMLLPERDLELEYLIKNWKTILPVTMLHST